MPSTKPFTMRYNEVVKTWLDLRNLPLDTETLSLNDNQVNDLTEFVEWYYLGK